MVIAEPGDYQYLWRGLGQNRARRPLSRPSLPLARTRRCSGPLPRQRHRESAPSPQLTDNVDVAAHQIAQLLADGEPEAGPAVAPFRGIDLIELVENGSELMWFHTDAGVFHGKADPGLISPVERGDATLDLTFLSEFGRIAEKIQKHLTDPACIANEHVVSLHVEIHS